MLFHVTWDVTDPSEAAQKRRTELFAKWQPGPASFKEFYGFADGAGGVAIAEAESAEELAQTLAPWVPFLKFTVRVILPIQDAAKIGGEAAAWRDAH